MRFARVSQTALELKIADPALGDLRFRALLDDEKWDQERRPHASRGTAVGAAVP
jgi:hypothetical protein